MASPSVNRFPLNGRQIIDAVTPYAHAAKDILAETLWPTRCAVCDEPGNTLCADCLHALSYIDWNRACPRCGAAFGTIQCSECNTVMLAAANRTEPPFDEARSVLAYDEHTRRIVSAYKDKGERRLACDMAEIMVRCIPPEWAGESVAMTFVPATSAAKSKRGFDHIELLSREIAQRAGIDHVSLFSRPRSSDQRQLSRVKRLENMKSRLQLLPAATPPNSVIVIDDVCTTGATLYAACDALKEGGAEHVYCLTFARV